MSADGHNGTSAVDVELFDVDIPEYRARRLKVKLKPEFAPGRGDIVRAAVHLHTLAGYQHYPVAEVLKICYRVGRDEHGAAALSHVVHEKLLADVLFCDVKPVEAFIEQQDLRRRGER